MRGLTPPFLWDAARAIMRGGRPMPASYAGSTFVGPFRSWEEAAEASDGYGSEKILEKVAAAAVEVKNGQEVYERDSVIFDEIQYAWPLLAGLMWVSQNEGKLIVCDYGGSLGTTYFQNRLSLTDNVRWNIIEKIEFRLSGKRAY
jgi:putative methyltransferase (TIGR04325 family)